MAILLNQLTSRGQLRPDWLLHDMRAVAPHPTSGAPLFGTTSLQVSGELSPAASNRSVRFPSPAVSAASSPES
jgi:hypothetical protein